MNENLQTLIGILIILVVGFFATASKKLGPKSRFMLLLEYAMSFGVVSMTGAFIGTLPAAYLCFESACSSTTQNTVYLGAPIALLIAGIQYKLYNYIKNERNRPAGHTINTQSTHINLVTKGVILVIWQIVAALFANHILDNVIL